MDSVVSGRTDGHYIDEEVLEQRPHVITGVDLFHLYLCVYVAVIQEVYVSGLDLQRNAYS